MSDNLDLFGNLQSGSEHQTITMEKEGWGKFSEEVAWFLYDFFRFKLDNYEKLIFYSYYINGLTLEEIGESAMKSTQAVNVEILNINKKLKKAWINRAHWKVTDDEREHANQPNRRRNKKRNKRKY